MELSESQKNVLKNNSLSKLTTEQRLINAQKTIETKRRKREKIESAAGLAISYLNSKTKIKEDGKTVTKSRSEFLFSMVDQIIAKRDRTSVEMLKVLFDAVKDNPTLIQNFNFNQSENKISDDLNSEYKKILAENNIQDAEVIEVKE